MATACREADVPVCLHVARCGAKLLIFTICLT